MVCDQGIHWVNVRQNEGLNPYSIGIWSATEGIYPKSDWTLEGLNPYSIGIWSATSPERDYGN